MVQRVQEVFPVQLVKRETRVLVFKVGREILVQLDPLVLLVLEADHRSLKEKALSPVHLDLKVKRA